MGPRDVAQATGVSTSTLRHYERQGLLSGVHRTEAGHRRYTQDAIERVLLVQRALVIGFSLAELRRVLDVRNKGGAPCAAVRALVAERLEALSRHIDQLDALREELSKVLAEWDQRLARTPKGQRARLLEALGTHPLIDRTRSQRRLR